MSDFQMTVGNAEIVALSDMNCVYPTPLADLWPNVPLEAWDAFRGRYADTFSGTTHMNIEIGCYLVRSQGKTILIDTGYGPGPIEYLGGLEGLLMADLASKQIDPAEVDVVFLSHLHLDHVGWNTMEQNATVAPTFPNARYVMHQSDLDHHRRPEVLARARYPYMDHCIEVLARAGVIDTVDGDHNLTDEVRAVHTPGHTPGHMSVVVSSQGQRAYIQGDVVIHPAQVTEEHWTPLFDGDPPLAALTRHKLLNELEADGTPVVSCHFPAPGFGRIVRVEGRRYWQAGL